MTVSKIGAAFNCLANAGEDTLGRWVDPESSLGTRGQNSPRPKRRRAAGKTTRLKSRAVKIPIAPTGRAMRRY